MHLKSYQIQNSPRRPAFLIEVFAEGYPEYWMYLAASPDATLGVIDTLLKEIWMGDDQVSTFSFKRKEYTLYPDSSDLKIRLGKIFLPGFTCTYTNNHFKPTVLHLVIKSLPPDHTPAKGSICVIARNSRVPYDCDICGNKADFFCNECYQEGGDPLICKHCLPDHDCSFEHIQIIPNSPLFGIERFTEDPDRIVRWYPAGWTRDEIIPPDLDILLDQYNQKFIEEDDEYGFSMYPDITTSMERIRGYFFGVINFFLSTEYTAFNPDHLKYYREVILQFLLHTDRYDCLDPSTWEPVLIQTILCEHLVFLPKSLPFDLENVIEILSRLFRYFQKAGLVGQSDDLIKGLQDYKFTFMDNCNSLNYNYFIKSLVSCDDEDNVVASVFDKSDILPLSKIYDEMESEDLNVDISLEYTKSLIDGLIEDLFRIHGRPPAKPIYHEPLSKDRYDTIRTGLEDYCKADDSPPILEECILMLDNLAGNLQSPLHKGECLLWSSAIIYTQYQENGLIKNGNASSCAEKIATFFEVKPNMARIRSSEIRKALDMVFQ